MQATMYVVDDCIRSGYDKEAMNLVASMDDDDLEAWLYDKVEFNKTLGDEFMDFVDNFDFCDEFSTQAQIAKDYTWGLVYFYARFNGATVDIATDIADNR